MDDRIRATAAAMARHLLLRYKAEHPNWTDNRTPIDDLVYWLGLHIETFHPDDYPQGTYGFLEAGEDLIWLRRTLSPSLRRFTLAHELGHAILHRDSEHGHREPMYRVPQSVQQLPELSLEELCQQPDVQEEVANQGSQELLEEVLGIGQTYDPRSERELAANIFAAELLMPLEQVQALYLDEHVSPGKLSSIFDVSNAAMLNRLVGIAMEGRPQEGRPQGSPIQWTGTPDTKPPTLDAKTIAKKHYDEFQQTAIEAPTPALIVAGPGSGKTSTLIGRTEYLINTLEVQPEQILALTFSRKAAQEMQERLEQVLYKAEQPNPEVAPHITPTVKTPTVSTFHAFCADILRTYGGLVGLRPDFTLIDETEGYFLLRQLAGTIQLYHYRNLKSPAYYFPDILKAISRAKDELVPPAQYRQFAQGMLESAHDEEAILSAKKALEIASIYELYEAALLQRGDTDFGGLIMLAVQLLKEYPEVLYEQQQRFQHILVDEFQDINRASGVLLRLLAGEQRRVWVVGDANQCQPAGTMIRLPDGSECPIEQLQPNREVVAYDRDSTMFVNKGKLTDVAVRQYDGLLYTVKAGGKQTQCTESHKWLVRWTSRGYDAWITYLMRQGNRYRVGQTRMFLKPGVGNKNSNSDFGLGSRSRQEKADAAWVLNIHDNLADALVDEQIIAAKYGLPEVVFSQSYGIKCFTQEMIDKIYNALPPLEEKARRCLEDHGRKLEYPLYLREGMNGVENGGRQRQGRSTIFETQACNLISGFMALPVAPTHIHSKRDHSMRRVVAESWQPIEVTCALFSGPVYSLNVAKYHKYVADGLVTCNSIYGFRGASPANIANFHEDYPNAVVLPLSRNYRSRPDIVLLAESFRWQQMELNFLATPEPEETTTEAAPSFPNRNIQTARLTHPETYVTVAKAEDTSNEFAGIIADIRYKHAQGYSYKDMAILCRTRAWAGKITRALVQAGLPVQEKRGILAQQHIKDLLSMLLLLTDENGMGILRAARQLAHPFSQSDIEALLLAARDQRRPAGNLIIHDEAPASMSIEGRRSLTRLSTILQSLYLHAPNVWSLLAQYLFIETSIMRDLLRNTAITRDDLSLAENGDSHDTNLLVDYLAFLQLARRYDQQQETLRSRLEQAAEERGEQAPHATPPPSIQEQLKGFVDYLRVLLRLGQDGGDSRENMRRGIDETGTEEPDIIRVMTVHASKGLEFPVVYLPGLIQRNFPLQAHANPAPAPTGMLPAGSVGKAAHESGESCLFYVGVTRARDQLVLSYSERNGKQKARPSAYLDALLAGLPPERISRLQWQGMIEEPFDLDEPEEDYPIEARPSSHSSQPSQSFLDAVKPTTLKAAHIETYQRCPRQYLYGAIYGFRSEEDAYQLFWQATQKTLEALQQYLSASEVTANGLPTVEEAQSIYSQHWQELGGPGLPFAAIYEQHGHEVTALLRDKLLASGDANWKLRHDVTVEAAGKIIHMTVDRVEAAPASKQTGAPARFVRTRFAKRKEKPTAGTRELLYAQAYRQLHGGQSLELHFHNLSTGETFPITLTAKKEQSLNDDLEQSIRGLERNEFPPKPDTFLCPTCPFFLICPA